MLLALSGHAWSAGLGDEHGFWKTHLAAAKVQGMALVVLEDPLNAGRHAITHFLSVSEAFHQAGAAQNPQMMRDVWLRLAQFAHKISDALLPCEQGFQKAQARFVGQRTQDIGTLPFSQYHGRHRPPDSTAATIWSTGHGFTRHRPTGPINDGKVLLIAVGSQHLQGF